MAVLLFTQLGAQAGTLGIQAAQFGFTRAALLGPGVGSIAGVVALDLQQFQLARLCCQRRLFKRVGLAQVADFVTATFKLRGEAILGHLRRRQALVQQGQLTLHGHHPSLHAPRQRHTWHCRHQQPPQHTGDIHRHNRTVPTSKVPV